MEKEWRKSGGTASRLRGRPTKKQNPRRMQIQAGSKELYVEPILIGSL